MEEEIMGARSDLEMCGIPKADMVGFRSPYLVHNPQVRDILHQNGLLYDSSIIEYINSQSQTSNSFSERLWPYTMDKGIVQDCEWTKPAGHCTEQENYPGLWEVPMWPLLNDTLDKLNNAYSMDPGPGFGGDVYSTFATNFDQAYNGNRAPFPIYLHAPWFTDDNIAATNKFIEYALSKGDVYFVTMTELINWMQNPIPASEYQKKANCKPVNVSKPTKTKCQTYIVQPGDFLQSIAGKFGIINVKDLVSVNPDVQVMTLKPGDKVKIPPWDASCTAEGTAQPVDLPSDQNMPTSEPIVIPETLTPSEATNLPVAESRPIDVAPPPINEICKIWTVVQDDFLGGVAKATGVSIDDIVRINDLFDSTVPLIVGQRLKIPPYPACCDSGTCNTEDVDAPADVIVPSQEAPTRVDISFSLNGVGDWNDEVKDTLTKILENELGIQGSGLEIIVVASRRSRRLSQVTLDNPVPLRVSISTDNPDSLYQVIRSELDSGDLETVLSTLGYKIEVKPTVQIFKDGIESPLPVVPTTEAKPVQQVTAPPQSSPETVQEDTFWTTTTIIAISVGGGVALLLFIGLIIFLVIRQRKKSEMSNGKDHMPKAVAGIPTADVTLRKAHLKSKDPCEIVIKSGFDTPTSPAQRTFFKENP
eukprot:jgi/Picsp_1/1729/NSC_05202-R1_hypothetical chitooligosaccharide deacetylase